MIKDKLDPVLHIVLGALRDPEEMVRGAASFALGQFAEHLQPEIVSHYQSVLPCILNALEDASDEVKEKSYYALAAFCDNMGEEILPFLDPLMGKLLGALHNSPRNLQETCMSAIGSVASAAEQAFVPYAERVLELMKSFLVLSNDEDLRSRARATELVGRPFWFHYAVSLQMELLSGNALLVSLEHVSTFSTCWRLVRRHYFLSITKDSRDQILADL